jgi:CRP-like cAMP-binding protein
VAALALFEAIGWRFRNANRTQVQFGASDTVGRIAARLVELCERHGYTTSSGIEIRLPLTQADLGAWTGASRASVAAALSTMRKLNWIETERKLVRVLDLKSLGLRAGLASSGRI